jgi:hypothetical protein
MYGLEMFTAPVEEDTKDKNENIYRFTNIKISLRLVKCVTEL